ncbi:H-NS histone family protein [Zoogloea dura]|nr:H-NS histone family protein [Zoogloea dura]
MRDIAVIQSEVDDLEKQLGVLMHDLDQKKAELKKAKDDASAQALKRIVDELNGLGFSKEELANALGMTVKPNSGISKKVRGERGSAEAKVKGNPKYQNPDDHDQTWTGMGRQPGWIKAHLQSGGSLESLLIKS